MDGIGSSGGGGPDPKTRLGGSSMAIMVSLLLMAGCAGDMTDTTSVPPTATVSEAIADPESKAARVATCSAEPSRRRSTSPTSMARM